MTSIEKYACTILIVVQTKEMGIMFLFPAPDLGESRFYTIGGERYEYTNDTNVVNRKSSNFNVYACPATSSFVPRYHYIPIAGYTFSHGASMRSHMSYCFYRHATRRTLLVLLWLKTDCNDEEVHCVTVNSSHEIHVYKQHTDRLHAGYFPDPNIVVNVMYAQMCIKYFELFMGPLELRNGTKTWIHDPLRPAHTKNKDPMRQEKLVNFDYRVMQVTGHCSVDHVDAECQTVQTLDHTVETDSIKQLRKENKEMEATIEELEKSHNALNRSLKAFKGRNTKLHKEVTVLTDAIDDLNAEVKALKLEIKQLKKSANSANTGNDNNANSDHSSGTQRTIR